ncbi:hypothetical protein [Methylobacillus sp. Pita1]|uniref:hypothetical protein n=1 Tax=Methylobacillus sp. Pita1 TaxID=3382642 RepID=UPI0038B4A34C
MKKKIRNIIWLVLMTYLFWIVIFYQPWNYNKSYPPTEVSIGEKIAKHSTEGGYFIPKKLSKMIKENVLILFKNTIKDVLLVDVFYFIDGKLSYQDFHKIVLQAKNYGFSIDNKIGAQRNNALEIAVMSRSCEMVKNLIDLGASPEIDLLKKDSSGKNQDITFGLEKFITHNSKLTYLSEKEKKESKKNIDCIIHEYEKLGFYPYEPME